MSRFLLPLAAALAAGAVLPTPTAGQEQRTDVCGLDVRMSSARPSAACLLLRMTPLPPPPTVDSGSRRFRLLPVLVVGGYRSGYPVDRNNGALWSGRGGSGSVSGGVAFRWGFVHGAVEPVVHASANRAFATPDTMEARLSRLAYPWAFGRLDWPLRRGSSGYVALDPGDSFIEAELGRARVGVSNERLRWGPARRYPLLFSGTGGGFPHAYAGTGRDVRTYLGMFGAQALMARLDESDWFDADPRNDFRYLSAVQLRWIPEVVPGLELSYAIARHEPLPRRRIRANQIFQLFTGDHEGEDVDRRGMAMGTFSFRLALPEEGFEVYAEIGRGEGFLNPNPGVSDTRLSQIYLMGFARTDTTTSGGRWRVAGEVVKQALELPQPSGTAPLSGMVGHGHTHGGQLLGAWIGPGSNAQYLAFDRLGDAWNAGFFAERVRRDDDTYFRTFANDFGFRGHDVEWTLGVRGGGWLDAPPVERAVGPLAMGFEAGISRRKNRNFTGLLGQDWIFVREWNAWADVYVRWDPSLRQ